MIKMTGGITSGTFSLLSQLAITTIERGGERILSRGILVSEQVAGGPGSAGVTVRGRLPVVYLHEVDDG